MAKLQYNQEIYSVIIPKPYIQQAKWEKGDVLTISFNERGNIELQKVKQ